MRIISSKFHGVLDYLVGIVLILAPTFGFREPGIASTVPMALGVATIVYSLITDYEWGIAKLIPFRAHLAIDVLAGIFLAMSPWLLGFADRVYMPHLILGLFEILAATLTYNRAYTSVNHQNDGDLRHPATHHL